MTVPGTMIQFVASQDIRLMHHLQRWRPPHWVRLWMIWATRGGDGWLWAVQAIAILIFGGPPRYVAVASAGVAAVAGIAIFLTLKKNIGRKRPSTIEPHCWATLLPPDQFSFPSGHTITAFAITVPIIHCYPGLTISLLFCAVSIAVSRIVLGMHFLSDILAGGLIGSAVGYSAVLLFF